MIDFALSSVAYIKKRETAYLLYWTLTPYLLFFAILQNSGCVAGLELGFPLMDPAQDVPL